MMEKRGNKKRRVFTPFEDSILLRIMNVGQEVSWSRVAEYIPGRTARQCRDRWVNYLNPNIEKKEWNSDDDSLLKEKYLQYGPKWAIILQFFPNTSYNSLKNHFYSKVSKQMPDYRPNDCEEAYSISSGNSLFPIFWNEEDFNNFSSSLNIWM